MNTRLAVFSLALAFTSALTACTSPQQSADDGMRPVSGGRYAVPNTLLLYQYSGGTTRPIPNSPLGIVDGCAAARGVRTGFDCR